MNNPYRIHSSIGFTFLQLLLLTTIAYPAPPPTIYQNVVLVRLATTVYFGMSPKDTFYLKLDCASIVVKVVCDALYVRYIITNYTYIFGIFDILCYIIFFIAVMFSLQNGGGWEQVSEKIEQIYVACVERCCGGSVATHQQHGSGVYHYTSLPSDIETPGAGPGATPGAGPGATPTPTPTTPIYTFGGRQPFKPEFYSSSWGRDYLNMKIDREFDTIHLNTTAYTYGDHGSATIHGCDGTEYIRFDEETSRIDASAAHYANIFVSPYFERDGTPITLLSGAMKFCKCNLSGMILTYNLIHFIYQLMMYSNIMFTCGAYHRSLYSNNGTTIGVAAAAAAAASGGDTMTRWLC